MIMEVNRKQLKILNSITQYLCIKEIEETIMPRFLGRLEFRLEQVPKVSEVIFVKQNASEFSTLDQFVAKYTNDPSSLYDEKIIQESELHSRMDEIRGLIITIF